MPLRIRSAEPADYAAIASILDAYGVAGPPSAEQLRASDEAAGVRDASFCRLVAEQRGEVVATGAFPAARAAVVAPGRLWMTLYLREDHRGLGIDGELLRSALSELGGVTEIWTCVREDQLDPIGVVRAEGFDERFRSWGARIDPQRFDAEPLSPLVRQLASGGVRLERYAELSADPDRDARLVELQRRLEEDAIVFEPVIPQFLEDVTSPDTIPESVMVAVAPEAGQDAYVGLASLLGDASRPALTCGFIGVERAYRRRGIATALLASVLRIARELGCRELNAGGGGVDASMMRISRRLGFEIEPAWITFARQRDELSGT